MKHNGERNVKCVDNIVYANFRSLLLIVKRWFFLWKMG